MDELSKYAINAPDVVAEDFDGQIVILNLANGHYFSLKGIAAPMGSSEEIAPVAPPSQTSRL